MDGDDKVLYSNCNFYNIFDNKMKGTKLGESKPPRREDEVNAKASTSTSGHPYASQNPETPASRTVNALNNRDVMAALESIISKGQGEKGKDKLNIQEGSENKFSWKSQLEQLLTYEETTKKLILRGEFHQAFGILDGLNRYSNTIREARFLLQFCGVLMISGRDQEAHATFRSFVDLIKSDFTCNSNEILTIAEKFGEREDYLASALLCLVAEELFTEEVYQNINQTQLSAAYQLKCMVVLREAASKLTEQSGKAKYFVRRYVVPPCQRMQKAVISVPETRDMIVHAFRMLQNMSYHALETIQLSGEDFEGRIDTLSDGLAYMIGVYGQEQVLKMKLYGTFYHNLGSAYLYLSKVQDAHQAFRKAMSVFEQATDFDNDEEKLSHMQKTGEMQRLCAAAFF